jgi:uncharacterized protein (TIGR03083 family)
MDEETGWQVVAAQRRSLVELLESLTEDQWNHPSLCAGWRVRDVVAHLVTGADPPSPWTMIGEAVRARGNMLRLSRDLAIRQGEQPADVLAGLLKAHADGRRLPLPGVTNFRDMVTDLLVHGQDIAIPLGLARPMPVDAAAVAATRVWTMGWPHMAKRKLRGLRLTATDIDWTVGDGAPVEGPIAALLLLVTGRHALVDQLSGEGVASLRVRV